MIIHSDAQMRAIGTHGRASDGGAPVRGRTAWLHQPGDVICCDGGGNRASGLSVAGSLPGHPDRASFPLAEDLERVLRCLTLT